MKHRVQGSNKIPRAHAHDTADFDNLITVTLQKIYQTLAGLDSRPSKTFN